MWNKLLIGALCCFAMAASTRLHAETLKLYIDADYSTTVDATQAIELGVRTALAEVDYTLLGTEIEVVPMDHRGNVKRSFRNMQSYLQDDSALAMVGGIHSPPYITHRDFMNENGVLTLLPWSAAGPVTRAAEGHENWIFRLSVDDSKSGEFLIRQAVDRGGCASVALLLLDSGWGRVNERTLTAALTARGMSPADVLYFPATAGTDRAVKLASDVRDSGADCAVLLASATNGSIVANALYSTLPSFRLYSHWGILGGGFTDAVPHKARAALQISVLQTCGLRAERQGSQVLEQALRAANTEASSLAELPAPTGFVHGYDLTRVLLAAIKQAKANDDWPAAAITQKRAMVRKALQSITDPVVGILGTYNPPFTPYSQSNKDGHEALGLEDMCIARFVEDGRLTDGG